MPSRAGPASAAPGRAAYISAMRALFAFHSAICWLRYAVTARSCAYTCWEFGWAGKQVDVRTPTAVILEHHRASYIVPVLPGLTTGPRLFTSVHVTERNGLSSIGRSLFVLLLFR